MKEKTQETKLQDLGVMLSFQASIAHNTEFVPKGFQPIREFVPKYAQFNQYMHEASHSQALDMKVGPENVEIDKNPFAYNGVEESKSQPQIQKADTREINWDDFISV